MTHPWHGTIGGYTNHACRCDDCTEAWRQHNRVYMREFRARERDERAEEQRQVEEDPAPYTPTRRRRLPDE